MKKTAKKSTGRTVDGSRRQGTKSAAKAVAKKSAKKPAPKAKAAPAPAAKGSVGTYKPQAIQGIGWAPFRYPLS